MTPAKEAQCAPVVFEAHLKRQSFDGAMATSAASEGETRRAKMRVVAKGSRLGPPALAGASLTMGSGESSGTAFLFGGMSRDGHQSHDLFLFDVASNSFVHRQKGSPGKDACPPPMSAHAAVVLGPVLVVFGGIDQVESFCFDRTFAFHIPSRAWINVRVQGEAPSARSGHSLVPIDATRAVLFGGSSPEAGPMQDVFLLAFEGVQGAGSALEVSLRWEPKACTGVAPAARDMHCAGLVRVRRRPTPAASTPGSGVTAGAASGSDAGVDGTKAAEGGSEGGGGGGGGGEVALVAATALGVGDGGLASRGSDPEVSTSSSTEQVAMMLVVGGRGADGGSFADGALLDVARFAWMSGLRLPSRLSAAASAEVRLAPAATSSSAASSAEEHSAAADGLLLAGGWDGEAGLVDRVSIACVEGIVEGAGVDAGEDASADRVRLRLVPVTLEPPFLARFAGAACACRGTPKPRVLLFGGMDVERDLGATELLEVE